MSATASCYCMTKAHPVRLDSGLFLFRAGVVRVDTEVFTITSAEGNGIIGWLEPEFF